jgi:hypothetical protein
MSTATTIAVASIVGAVAGAGATALAISLLARDHAAVSATIVVSPGATQCTARTFPATLLAGRKDRLLWTVTGDFSGNCAGVDPNNVELQFVGPCQPDGSKVSSLPLPQLFDETTPLRGRKIRRTLRHGDESCFSYRVMHNGAQLEDPEMEIVQY